MTELMKRYEAETGKNLLNFIVFGGKDVLLEATKKDIWLALGDILEFNAWLVDQLTWRPVSEKPEKADMYFAEVRPYTGCESTIITTAYFDGESFIWHDVVKWLPIPPQGE